MTDEQRQRDEAAFEAFWPGALWGCMESEKGTSQHTWHAALAYARREAGWRTMESAPRDGSCFLGWRDGWVPGTCYFDAGRFTGAVYEPTLWAPLPPAPNAAEKDRG